MLDLFLVLKKRRIKNKNNKPKEMLFINHPPFNIGVTIRISFGCTYKLPRVAIIGGT
jgi:hypothetical protein